MIGIAIAKACRPPLPWCAALIGGLLGILSATPAQADTTNYFVRGILKSLKPEEQQLVIAHEEIPDFMDAMTMPFNVKDPAILTNAGIGETITFQLHVTETESWVDHIERFGVSFPAADRISAVAKDDFHPETKTNSLPAHPSKDLLRNYKFTNERGQPVRLSDFRGQAIALTFFFTRCPIPEFCPRLSRNFEAVQRKLKTMDNAPTNWHLLSVTFDPDHDTPAVLKAYGASYQYDPVHWSFLTGPKDKIAELARACDVKFDPDNNGLINHNFRTLIIDASNRLQMVFPTSGDISESIAQELVKAASGAGSTVRSATNTIRSGPDK